MTKREEILRHIETLLKANGVVPADRVLRSQIDPVGEVKLPAISIRPGVDTPTSEMIYGPTDWSLNIRVSVVARGIVPDKTADPIVEAVTTKLMEDRSLGGLAMDLSVGPVVPTFDELDSSFVDMTCNFQVTYRT